MRDGTAEVAVGGARISYALDEVRVGPAVLARGGERAPQPHLEERTVSFDRGEAVQEQYVLGEEALEQLFVISRLPADRGAIRITGRVRTDLEPPPSGTAGERLVFTSGGVEAISFSKALAIDGAGRREPLAMTYEDGRVTVTVPAAWVSQAPLPITVDPLIGGPQVLDTKVLDRNDEVRGREVRICDTAYDPAGDRWLVVWTEPFGASDFDADVLGQFVGADGAPVGGPLDIATTAAGEYEPAVGFGAGRFLVVWRHDPDDNGSRRDQDIYGRIVLPDGSFASGPFAVVDPPRQDYGPSLAFDGTRWYVVATNARSKDKQDILGRFVTLEGKVDGRADPDVEGDFAARPSVDYGSKTYVVAWEKGPSRKEQDVRIVARTMAPSGAFMTGALPLGPSGSTYADVSAGAGRFLVLWQQAQGDRDHDIQGRVVSPALGWETELLVLARSGGDQVTPRAAYSAAGNEWYGVYGDPLQGKNGRRTDIYGTRISSTGAVFPADRLTQNKVTDWRPELAWGAGRNEMLVVFLAGRYSPYELQAVRFSMDGAAPPAPGEPAGPPNPNTTGTYTVTWAPSVDTGGSGLAAYELERSADGGVTFAPVARPVANSFTELGLAEGVYLYRVRAVDNGGNSSAYSSSSTPVVVDQTPPAPPDGLAQFQTDGQTPIPKAAAVAATTVVLSGRGGDPDAGQAPGRGGAGLLPLRRRGHGGEPPPPLRNHRLGGHLAPFGPLPLAGQNPR